METRQAKKKRLLMLMNSKVEYIPEEITTQILAGLPTKSLVRFKCVCKTWQSWISNMKGEERSFFYIQPNNNKVSPRFYTLDEEFVVQQIPHPFKMMISSKYDFNYLGSCNGLLLFSLSKYIYLWNPTTRCCKEVLQLNLLAEKARYTTVPRFLLEASGLCFDDSTNDYKVVIALSLHYKPNFVLVGSLKSKEWTEINFSPYASAASGCYVNGRLHWITEKGFNSPNIILYFDAKNQEFNKLSIPEHVKRIRAIKAVDGFLSIAYSMNDRIEILIMRKYGVKESCTRIWDGQDFLPPPGTDPKISVANLQVLIAKFRWLLEISANLEGNSVQLPLKNYYNEFDFNWHTYVQSLSPIHYGEMPRINLESKAFKDEIKWLPKCVKKRGRKKVAGKIKPT